MSRAREIADLVGGATPDIILKTSDGAILNLQTSDTTVTADSVLGEINFQAPDEASGTDSILIASKIQAVAEGTFSASSNATSLVFTTANSAAAGTASGKMTFTSGGELILKDTDTADGSSPTITLQSGDTDIAADDVLGTINFQAPDEGTGTDAILVAAGIAAVSEGDFSSSSNATSLIFKTGASAAADEKMRIASDGNVGIGITPSAMADGTGVASLQLGGTFVTHFDIDAKGTSVFGNNKFYDGSNNKALFAGEASDYLQFSGVHTFRTAASVSAGANNTMVERMRLDIDGNFMVSKTAVDTDTAGIELRDNGLLAATRTGGSPLFLNRLEEGGMIEFTEAGAARGQIDIFQDRLLIRGAGDVTGLRFDSGNYTVFKNGSSSDDAVDLGFGSGRFDDIFATNGTIQTSDRNDKQDIATLTSKEMLVAKRISTLFKTYRWKAKVAEKAAKGETARTHTGVIAQDVQDAFTAEGLDAGDYSLFIESPWWEKDVEVAAVEANEDEGIEAADAYTRTDKWASEDEAPEGSTKKTRLGMRYPELLSFLAAYNEQRFAAIETRLTALEDA